MEEQLQENSTPVESQQAPELGQAPSTKASFGQPSAGASHSKIIVIGVIVFLLIIGIISGLYIYYQSNLPISTNYSSETAQSLKPDRTLTRADSREEGIHKSNAQNIQVGFEMEYSKKEVIAGVVI